MSLQVQDVDTLMMELRTKFVRVLEEEPVQPLVLDDAEGEVLDIEVAETVTAEAEIAETETASVDGESKSEVA